MANSQTPNYNLNQWAADDQVLRTEFNQDNEKIDTALHNLAAQIAASASQSTVDALEEQLAQKASQSEVNTLKEQVAQKAAQSDLDALEAEVALKAPQSSVTALESQMNSNMQTLREEITAGDLWVKLAQTTLQTAGTNFQIDLSHIDFTDYSEIHIHFLCDYCPEEILITANQFSEYNGYRQSKNPFSGYGYSYGSTDLLAYLFSITPNAEQGQRINLRMISRPIWPEEHPVFYCDQFSMPESPTVYRYECAMMQCTWATLNSLEFTCAQNIPAGCRFTMYGLR